jgi:hypothetical protein
MNVLPALLLALFSQVPCEKQPKILFAETELHFGVMDQLAVKTEEVPFLNDGDADLVIKGLTTDCSCVPVLVTKKVIKPNEEGVIRVTLSTDLEPGKIEGSFLVHTNDPDLPEARIKLLGTVKPAYAFEPAVINFGLCFRGDPKEARLLKISPVKAKSLKIKSLACSSEHISLECESPVYDGENPICIHVKLRDSIPAGRFKANLTLETDHPCIRFWNIPVIGVVRDTVSVEPTLVTLGSVKQGETPSAFIRITWEGEGPFKILDVIRPEDYFKVEEKITREGKEYAVLITLSRDAPRGMFDKEVSIRIQTSRIHEFKVRVLGMVSG